MTETPFRNITTTVQLCVYRLRLKAVKLFIGNLSVVANVEVLGRVSIGDGLVFGSRFHPGRVDDVGYITAPAGSKLTVVSNVFNEREAFAGGIRAEYEAAILSWDDELAPRRAR